MRIFVHGLRLEAEIGLLPHERGGAQPLVVHIQLDLAPRAVMRIGDTVDYDRLAASAREIAGSGHIDLVETFAQRLAAACLEHTQALVAVVRVEKPGAIADAACAGVEVTLVRTR